MVDGRIVASGGMEIAQQLDRRLRGLQVTATTHVRHRRKSARLPDPVHTRHGKRLAFLDSAASSQRPNQVIDAMAWAYKNATPTCTAACTDWRRPQPTPTKRPGGRWPGSSAPTPQRDHLHQERHRGTQPGRRVTGARPTWARRRHRAYPAWSTTPTSSRGRCWPRKQASRSVGSAVTPDGQLDLSNLDVLLDGAKLLSVASMSNVLGTLNPVEDLVARAHAAGAVVCLDACQSVPHLPTDVAASGADFIAFSGHKMLGPSGIGVLWGRKELLDAMPPFLGGGGMIANVTTEGFTPDEVPSKFEAGTPPIVEAVGLGAAIRYLESFGMEAIRKHEVELTGYAMRTLTERLGDALTIHGPAEPAGRGGVLSLALDGVHAHDVSQVLDNHAVCVRPGHHCAKPLMKELGVAATARASFYLYNDTDDVDTLADALVDAQKFFAI